MIIMPANIPHSVNAVAKFKMLLTMMRHKEVLELICLWIKQRTELSMQEVL